MSVYRIVRIKENYKTAQVHVLQNRAIVRFRPQAVIVLLMVVQAAPVRSAVFNN